VAQLTVGVWQGGGALAPETAIQNFRRRVEARVRSDGDVLDGDGQICSGSTDWRCNRND
jgi:hypothetical protein